MKFYEAAYHSGLLQLVYAHCGEFVVILLLDAVAALDEAAVMFRPQKVFGVLEPGPDLLEVLVPHEENDLLEIAVGECVHLVEATVECWVIMPWAREHLVDAGVFGKKAKD